MSNKIEGKPTGYEDSFKSDSHWITGEIHDVIIDKEGNRTELPVDHNLVVASCSELIAALMKGTESSSPASPAIKYWAIGGYGSGDQMTASDFSDPASGQTTLVNEKYRQEILPENISFVSSDNSTTATRTNKIKVTIVVGYDDANFNWVEFGIFGGAEATTTSGSGIMINRKKHEVISKTNNLQVERTLIFTF